MILPEPYDQKHLKKLRQVVDVILSWKVIWHESPGDNELLKVQKVRKNVNKQKESE